MIITEQLGEVLPPARKLEGLTFHLSVSEMRQLSRMVEIVQQVIVEHNTKQLLRGPVSVCDDLGFSQEGIDIVEGV